MPIQSDKRVLWHPRHTNKFVVGGGSQITLYELSDEQPEIRHVTSQHDLHYMKCFAWSPVTTPHDIFAVGHSSSGRVDILRLEASRYSQVGSEENVLSTGPILSLHVQKQRSCNALAFCTSDPNYLAVGLDKVRGDSSLVIWDVEEEMRVFRAASNLSDDAHVVLPYAREPTNKRSTYTPIPRTDYPLRNDQRIVQAHAQTDLISTLAWLPQNIHPYLLLAGISPRWLRLFDLRNPAGSGAGATYVSSIAAKVTGIATDPFDPTRFATWGDGNVTIWDIRKLQVSRFHADSPNATPTPTQLLTFSEKDAGIDSTCNNPSLPVMHEPMYVAAEFSPTRRGMLATLAKDANFVRLWDVLEAGDSPAQHELGNLGEDIIRLKDKAPASRKSWANLPWNNSDTSNESQDPLPFHVQEHAEQIRHPTLILSNTRRSSMKNMPNSLCSFAVVPPVYPSHRTRSKIVVVSQSGEVAVQRVYDAAQTLAWSSHGDMLYGTLDSKDDTNMGLGIISSHHDERGEEIAEGPNAAASHVSSNGARARSNSKPLTSSETDGLPERGRPRTSTNLDEVPPSPALFGRGDAEGFPALSRPNIGPTSANLTATRSLDTHKERQRTFSPAAVLRVPMNSMHIFSSPLDNPAESRYKTSPFHLLQTHAITAGRNITIAHGAMQNDVSVLMRRRAMRGYSIRDPLRNASIIRELARIEQPGAPFQFEEPSVFKSKESKMLADLWEWIYHSQNYLSSPTALLHGYDFSFAGVWGIWDGPPSIATPVHRDRLELPAVLDAAPLFHGLDRTRYSQPQDMMTNTKRTRTRSPIQDPLINDPEWHQALLDLFSRTAEPLSTSPIFPYISTSKPLQRHICLHLIGWGFVLRSDSFMAEVRRWERENEGEEGFARAAAWLVFSGRYGGAIECLLRSEDESHHMMSGVVAALAPFASATLTSPRSSSKISLPSTLREHYDILINKLQDSYLRALLSHLIAISSADTPSGEHWLEILREEDLLPFYERLALAFCFLDDTALTTYLRRCREHALSNKGGDVDALVVTGLGTSEGRQVISLWLDRLGDVQSAALLGWTGLGSGRPRSSQLTPDSNDASYPFVVDPRVNRWVETYRDFLDSIRLFHCRVEFDIERGETLQLAMKQRVTNLAPRQILIRCNYCNKIVAPNTQSSDINLGPGQNSIPQGKPTACPHCGRALPRCSICLMTLGIVPDAHREADLTQYRDTIDDAILLCLGCRHGGHASHILQWFFGEDGNVLSNRICPVADCAHRCGNEF
ncbi:hypothetical protein EV361DRAFT_794233 [Lentinula raphanica]|uniref:Uncharacterized protein n=1 Tax=Lentinula raphanica TaxID=153919 RepID=A0AA38PC56_9AGAR|nr:hypothetical protein F5880DRAFT_1469081 [Lentinula raphanica]KAJ3840198.1 hypothetical protein F5878DRAFT_534097 [Lentinula raphanica]KAJ3974480.1 hypothetical protein EV361DRAFT_794233 [Lentinula raphanica]